jgi:hypothetical protein
MIIYNVTTKVTWEINDAWLEWMRNDHIPQVLKTGCFFDSRILRLLEVDDDEGPTYAVQYHASGNDEYREYIEQHASGLRKHANEKWGNQIISFRSVMEVLH